MENKKQLFVAIDFETANSDLLSACAVGIIVFFEGEVIFEYESLIKPPKANGEFKYFNTTIHKITASDVKNAPTWDKIYPLIFQYLNGSIIVAHNAKFDISVLKALNTYYELNLLEADYFCSVELSRLMLPYLKNHKLDTVSDFLDIKLDHHNAKSDAMAAAMIVYKCMIITKDYNVNEFLDKIELKTKKIKD